MSARRILHFAASALCATGIFALPASSWAQAATTLPADPVAGEDFMVLGVFCRGGGPTWFVGSDTRIEGSAILIDARFDGSDFSVPSCARMNATVPGLAAGNYSASLTAAVGLAQSIRALGTVTVRASAAPALPAHRGLSGNWFDDTQPGWGVNIVQGASGALFAAWMNYQFDFLPADRGEPRPGHWTVMSRGRWMTPTTFRGLFHVTQGSAVTRPFDSSAVRILGAGMGTFTFTDERQVEFEGVLVEDGTREVRIKKTLRRFAF